MGDRDTPSSCLFVSDLPSDVTEKVSDLREIRASHGVEAPNAVASSDGASRRWLQPSHWRVSCRGMRMIFVKSQSARKVAFPLFAVQARKAESKSLGGPSGGSRNPLGGLSRSAGTYKSLGKGIGRGHVGLALLQRGTTRCIGNV